MRILTERLRIELTFQNELIRIYAYPHKEGLSGTHAMIPISYDESNIESDVDVKNIISELVDEKEEWENYLNGTAKFDEGVYIENYISPFSIPSMGQDFLFDRCLIEMVTPLDDLLNTGYLEKEVIKEVLDYHGCITISTAIALETIKYSRLAVANMEPIEV